MRRRASADRRKQRGPRIRRIGAPATVPDTPVRLDANVQAHIGKLLRVMYDSTMKEPVPERFLDLLQQMDVQTERPTGAAVAGLGETK